MTESSSLKKFRHLATAFAAFHFLVAILFVVLAIVSDPVFLFTAAVAALPGVTVVKDYRQKKSLFE